MAAKQTTIKFKQLKKEHLISREDLAVRSPQIVATKSQKSMAPPSAGALSQHLCLPSSILLYQCGSFLRHYSFMLSAFGFAGCPYSKVAPSHCWRPPWPCCPCPSGRVLPGLKTPVWSTPHHQNSQKSGRVE